VAAELVSADVPVADPLPGCRLSRALAESIGAEVGDLVYITDARDWLGGLRSVHTRVVEVHDGGPVEVSADTFAQVGRAAIRVQRMY
jgi:hypothetical protein